MSLSLDPKSTALVIIDLLNLIVRMPVAPHTGSEVVERSARLASQLRGAGGTVAYVRVDVSQFKPRPVDQPMQFDAKSLPPQATELVANSGYQAGDLLIVKHSWGAFYGTSLDQLLRHRQIRTIILAGIATNQGVESTARSAFDRGYDLVFAEDAMSSMSAESHRFAIETIFPRLGLVRSTDAIGQALTA